ncbi:MAG: AI-2E family transporter [Clostridiales bacterium]|nr:AI-2E family transporter [Clostridiales bacterium]
MESLKNILQKPVTIRVITLGLVALLIYLMKDMLNMMLLTFLFAYLMYSLQKSLQNLIHKIVRVRIERFILTLLLYVVVVSFLVVVIYKYVPLAIEQIMQIFSDIAVLANQPEKVYDNQIMNFAMEQLRKIDFATYIGGKSSTIFKLVGDIGQWGFNLFIAILLSLFFILEKDRVARFFTGFENSRIAPVYKELKFYSNRLLNSFGKVIQAQLLIALCNSILSDIGLKALGFSQLLGLGTMIFILSLIPVAGVVISFVPLAIIAYQIGGYKHIIYVIVLILVLHAIEAYLLNPKLMSMKTELPVFMTFLLLILSEHFIGIWGLIIGIPIFIFILDLIDFKIPEKKEGLKEIISKVIKDVKDDEKDDRKDEKDDRKDDKDDDKKDDIDEDRDDDKGTVKDDVKETGDSRGHAEKAEGNSPRETIARRTKQ